MKRMRELISKIDDSGLSFVEVLITMAIMAVVGTTVAGAMYVSSRSYTRGAAEVNVQEEAQVALNLISDWVMDATAVENPDGTTLKITHPDEGVVNTITVYQSGKQLMYKVDTDPTAYVLCDYLEDSGVHFDSTFDTDRNVKVSLDFNINGRTYHAATDSTSRNHDFTLNSTGSDVLNLVVPDSEIVLEPGMTGSAAYSFEAVVYGASSAPTISKSDETGDFDYSVGAVTASGPSTYKCTITVACRQYAMNDGSFKLTASYTDSESGTTFTDTEIIVTKVRRVTKCEYQNNDKGYLDPLSGPADAGKNGSVYVNTVDLGALNWPPRLSSDYDKDTYAYVDPLHVEFYLRYDDGTVVPGSVYEIQSVVDHGAPNPSIQIVLKQDITKDIKVYVSAVHSGSNSITGTSVDNKASRILGSAKPYTTSGSAYVSYFMIKKTGDPDIGEIGAGFQRGSRAFRLGRLSPARQAEVQAFLNSVERTNYLQVVSFKYKKVGDSNYIGPIYVSVRPGNEGIDDWALWGNSYDNQQRLADIFDCDSAYTVEVSYDLLQKGTFATIKHFESTGTVNAANPFIYNSSDGMFYQQGASTVGSIDSPVVIDKNASLKNFYVYFDSYNCITGDPYKITAVNGYVERYNGPATRTTEELNDPNNWVTVYNNGSQITKPQIQGAENLEIGNTITFSDGTHRRVGNFQQNDFPDPHVTVVKNECGCYQSGQSGLYRVRYATYGNPSVQRAQITSMGSMPSSSNPNGSVFGLTTYNNSSENLGTVYYEIVNF